MPLTAICNERYTDPRQRQLFKNIIYVGALASLLGIDIAEVEQLIAEQFKGKDKLIPPNYEALHMGRDYAEAHLKDAIGLKVRRADAVGDRIFLEGNDAAGARRGLWRRDGLRLVSDHALDLAGRGVREALPAASASIRRPAGSRYAIVQAEDELASIGMVIGAAWNGARAFTATSGPGISLMQEFLGLAYFAEIPAVIFDVQRGGPFDRHADAHAAIRHPDLAPTPRTATPSTCCCSPRIRASASSSAPQAFDLADRLQTPVFVLLDLDIGMNEWLCEPLAWDDSRRFDRGKVLTAEELEAGREFRPLPRRRRRRHSLPHLSGHAPDQGLVLHPRHVARPLRPLHRGGRRPTSTTCSGCCASSRRRRRSCRSRSASDATRPTRVRRDLFRLDRARHARGHGDAAAAAASTSTCCACAPSRSPTR